MSRKNKRSSLKKGFTTMELLMSLVVSMMLMTMLFLLLLHTTKLHNDTLSKVDGEGFTLVLVSDIENLTRGCDYVEVVEEARVLVVHDNDEKYVIDVRDYGVDARLVADSYKQIISIYIGGEAYCVPYMQNDPF